MPASMTELLGNRRRVDIPKADGSPGIYVVYRPQSMTPRKMHELLSLEQAVRDEMAAHADAPAADTESADTDAPADSDDATAAAADLDADAIDAAIRRHTAMMSAADEQLAEFAAILIDWDLTDDNGNPIPPTLEGLQDVDFDVLTYIFGKVRADAQMKRDGTAGDTPGDTPGDTAGKAHGTPPLTQLPSTLSPTERQATKPRRSRHGSR